MNWQLQEAKQRFSEVVRRALSEGPQVVTKHGQEAVFIVSAEDYRRLMEPRTDFIDFLMSAPDLSILDEVIADRKRNPFRSPLDLSDD